MFRWRSVVCWRLVVNIFVYTLWNVLGVNTAWNDNNAIHTNTLISINYFSLSPVGFILLSFVRYLDINGRLVRLAFRREMMNYGSKTTFGFDADKRKLPLSKKLILYAYDKDTGEIFGRKPSGWGELLIVILKLFVLETICIHI